jgi:hypothetical protein
MTARGAASGTAAPGGTASGGTATGGPLRIVVAPDSFKGSLTSVEVAAAIAAGWLAARPRRS